MNTAIIVIGGLLAIAYAIIALLVFAIGAANDKINRMDRCLASYLDYASKYPNGGIIVKRGTIGDEPACKST